MAADAERIFDAMTQDLGRFSAAGDLESGQGGEARQDIREAYTLRLAQDADEPASAPDPSLHSSPAPASHSSPDGTSPSAPEVDSRSPPESSSDSGTASRGDPTSRS